MNDLRRHLVNKLYTGHKHFTFKEMLACNVCAGHVMKFEKEWKRLTYEKPDEFKVKEPEYKPSYRTQDIGQKLEERIKTDKNYRKELERRLK